MGWSSWMPVLKKATLRKGPAGRLLHTCVQQDADPAAFQDLAFLQGAIVFEKPSTFA